eukprot:GFYU01000743.1.p1 GENE.GFYU01000743.1~~GFYU01000743.1.p1  ORF type:complete len:534 (-),score=199.36 GFYU01000743.1:260-1861(-)
MAAVLDPSPQIMKANSAVEKGENARLASFVGAIALCDLIKTTLGPKGMDKILQSASRDGGVTVTNDGATILKAITLDNPAAKILVDISKAVDDEIGDGTTSVTVLAGELLREAEKLINQHMHPQVIIQGWREAADVARPALESFSEDYAKQDPAAFREALLKIARTTLSSKLLTHEKDHFAELAVSAVLRLGDSLDLEKIQIIKKPGGSLRKSYLDEGFLLDKKFGVSQSHKIKNAKILIANTPMDTDKVKIYGTRVRVDSLSQVADIEAAEKAKMTNKCQKILNHNINVFINRQLIYNHAEQIFTSNGVTSIEHADFDGIERLASVLGGDIVSTFENPESVILGEAELVDEVIIGEDKLIRFSGCKGGSACSIVLRGGSLHVLDEAERSLHDALCVLVTACKDRRIVYGGGASETLMANVIDELAHKTSGKKALAMEAFARALRAMPTIIADNAGFDSSDLVAELRAEHKKGNKYAGLDMTNGVVGDVKELGIVEAFRSKQQMLLSAAEAAEMILRVDNIVRAAPRERQQGY